MNKLIAGIDPSTKEIGIAILDVGQEIEVKNRIRLTAPFKVDMFTRIRQLIRAFYNGLDLFEGVELVIIEKPASKLNFSTLYALSVLGGGLYAVLVTQLPDVEIRFVAPTTAKKCLAGSGRASKEEIMAAVTERFGIVEKNDNIADAISVASTGIERE